MRLRINLLISLVYNSWSTCCATMKLWLRAKITCLLNLSLRCKKYLHQKRLPQHFSDSKFLKTLSWTILDGFWMKTSKFFSSNTETLKMRDTSLKISPKERMLKRLELHRSASRLKLRCAKLESLTCSYSSNLWLIQTLTSARVTISQMPLSRENRFIKN